MILTCVILTALSVNGLSIATDTGMILEPVKKWVKGKIGTKKIYKPLIGCVRCMPSIYGTLICLLVLPFGAALLWQVPLVIAASSALAAVINSQYL